jgi:RecG-like helicase
VFFDSKKEAYTALDGCRNWLLQSEQHQYSKKQVKDSIKVFHRDIAKYDKEAILQEFQRPAKDSSIRIIFATEALGLGVNLPVLYSMAYRTGTSLLLCCRGVVEQEEMARMVK